MDSVKTILFYLSVGFLVFLCGLMFATAQSPYFNKVDSTLNVYFAEHRNTHFHIMSMYDQIAMDSSRAEELYAKIDSAEEMSRYQGEMCDYWYRIFGYAYKFYRKGARKGMTWQELDAYIEENTYARYREWKGGCRWSFPDMRIPFKKKSNCDHKYTYGEAARYEQKSYF